MGREERLRHERLGVAPSGCNFLQPRGSALYLEFLIGSLTGQFLCRRANLHPNVEQLSVRFRLVSAPSASSALRCQLTEEVAMAGVGSILVYEPILGDAAMGHGNTR